MEIGTNNRLKDGYMGFYQMFILVSLLVLSFIVIMVSKVVKQNIKPMQGMTISMFFSMNIGLTMGILLGVSFQGNLFYSTILSIIIGMMIGFLSGSIFGTLSMLEGGMTGLMAGMMGAMLGEMVNSEQSVFLIRIFLLLSIFTIFLFVILPNTNQKNIGFKKPFFLAIIILCYVFIGIPYAEQHINFYRESSLQNHDSHINDLTNVENKETKVITIEANKMKYSPTEVILDKDQAVTIELKNNDNVDHDIEVMIPTTNSTHDHDDKKENMIHLHVGPNNTQKISFTPIRTGKFEFVCTVPGHKELGMVGSFVIK